VNDDLKELLRDKADEMRLGPRIPQPVLRRSRRRRMLNTALAGSLAAVLGVGAFVGARAAMNAGAPAPGGIAHQPSVAPTPTVTPTPSPSPAGPPAAIVVSEPSPGDTVTSPVHISGTADVFEAQVSYKIADASGNEIAGGAVAASCGSGCRGTFSINAAFSVPREQAGTIEVYEASAKDGSRIHVVDIPVTLEPGGAPPAGQNGDVWIPTSSGDAADPQKTAVAFARDVMGWAPNDVRVGPIGNGDQIAADIWNTSLTSTFTHATATTLVMHTMPAGGSWSVMHAETGVLNVTCPSNMQDGLIITDRNGRPTMEICGTLTQSNSGWTVQATVEYADSNLQPSEAESTGEIPVQGTDVHGWLPLNSTYAYPSSNLVSVQVQVLDQNMNVIAEFARTLVTTG
jgi:hypothetical protein